MLPAHWALAGRETGRRWREKQQQPPSPRKPEWWKPQVALAAALPLARAEDGGMVMVAHGCCSAGGVAGAEGGGTVVVAQGCCSAGAVAGAEDGGTVVVAQGRCSAGAVAGAAAHCSATDILLLSAGGIKWGEHPLPHQGWKMRMKRHSSRALASFGIWRLPLERTDGPALPLLCRCGVRRAASPGVLEGFGGGSSSRRHPDPERHRAPLGAPSPPAGSGCCFRARRGEGRRSREGGESAGARCRRGAGSFDLTSRLCPSAGLIVSHLLWK